MLHHIKHTNGTYEKANIFHIVIVLLAISQIADIVSYFAS